MRHMTNDPERRPHDNEDVDEAGEESFPASDPPGYSGGSATPEQAEEEEGKRYPGHLDRDEEGEDV